MKSYFRPREDAAQWNTIIAEEFFNTSFGDNYPLRHMLAGIAWDPTRSASTGELNQPKPVTLRARAGTADGDRFVQAWRNVLVYNMLRKTQEWPGFEALKSEALDALEKYVSFTNPEGIQRLSLNYRDLVAFPADRNEGMLLSDYLSIYPEAPNDRFGSLSDFALDVGLPACSEHGIMRIKIKSEPSLGQEEQSGASWPLMRFRIDWELSSQQGLALDRDELDKWLTGAHQDMFEAFKSAFTDAAWQTFGPEE